MGRNAPPRLVVTTTLVRAGVTPASAPPTPRLKQKQGGAGDPALRPPAQRQRGFAADPQRAAEAGRRGGKRGQAKGTAHRWTSEEARRAGALRGDPGMGKGQRRRKRG